MEHCKCMHQCLGECPESVICPLDKPFLPSKNRATSRNRHHDMVRERKKSKTNAQILSSKANNLPWNATYAEISKAERKAYNANRIFQRYKKYH